MKLIIFDLDGTIADTIDGIMFSTNMALESHGLEMKSRDFYVNAIGGGAKVLIEKTLGPENVSLVETILKEFMVNYSQHWQHELSTFEGVKVVVDELKDNGYTLAVNTNKPHDIAVKVVDFLFEANTFIDVKGAHESYPKKPDPSGVNLILKNISDPVETIIYVGDSIVDANTSVNANLPFIGVSWGYGRLDKSDYKMLVDSSEELLQAIYSI